MAGLVLNQVDNDQVVEFSPNAIDRSRPIGPQIYELVRLNIILNVLQPGAPINEQDLCDMLGVSRTPVREAYQKLAQDGLIRSTPKVGSVVTEIDRDRVVEGAIIRRALEREVLTILCEKEVPLAPLDPIIALQNVAVQQGDSVEFFKQDEQFHFMLAKLAGIPAAWRATHLSKAHTDRARIRLTSDFPKRIQKAFDDHLKILAALNMHDAVSAVEIMNEHINSTFEGDALGGM